MTKDENGYAVMLKKWIVIVLPGFAYAYLGVVFLFILGSSFKVQSGATAMFAIAPLSLGWMLFRSRPEKTSPDLAGAKGTNEYHSHSDAQ